MPEYDGNIFDPPAPVVRVTLRNPHSKATMENVPMLLDSGADATLLPLSFTKQLGITPEPNDLYELMGFDGRISAAHVVQADLVFLNRAFKGRFLLIDQEWGLIGRDVLNHLKIILDGPKHLRQEQS
jgi:hypothetical protein